MPTDWQVKMTQWSNLNDQREMKKVREDVFIREQSVPVELEWDGLDEDCLHCIVQDKHDTTIGTARMQTQGSTAHIGRMAVLKPYRKKGVGTLIMHKLLEQALTDKVKQLTLNAQTTAIPFYQRIGFVSEGGEFDDAGIPHYRMVLCVGNN